MSEPRVDLVAVVEGLYSLDLAPDQWLLQGTELLRPLLDRHHLGILASFYECADPCSYVARRTVVLDLSSAVAKQYFSYIADPDPTFIADTILSRRCYFCTRVPAASKVREQFAVLRAFGAVDKLSINTVEPDGHGCCFGSFQADLSPLSPHNRVVLRRIAGHLAAAHRLRRRFERASVATRTTAAVAVMTPDGRVQHAVGAVATDRCFREALRHAARARDRARTRRGRQDSLEAIREWTPLVGDRWMLLDQVEHDGRRFILAVEGEPGDRQAPLSPREHDIVQRMLAGQTDKVIAYELALAPATIRVLMSRAMAKLGARSRADLRTTASRLRPNKERSISR